MSSPIHGFAAGLLAMAFSLIPLAAASATATVTGFVAVTDGSGSKQISSFDLSGGHERRLTAGPADHHYPSISADGQNLLYVGDDGGRDEVYRLSLARPDARPQQVTAPPLFAESPGWSPDGRSIAYSAILTGWSWFQIFVARPDGNRPVQVSHDTDGGSSQPAFSPDGKRIAYIHGRPRDDRIWVMNVDGTGARPLTDGPLDAYPAWLDDNTVVFAREDPTVHQSTVLAIRLDGGPPVVISPDSVSAVEPRPMPDGRSYGATAQIDGALHLVTITRSDGRPLTDPGATGYVVNPIQVASEDGSVFTMSWITAAAPRGATPAPTIVPFLVAALGLAVLAAAAAGSLYKNERLLV